MIRTRIANRYARALFELAQEADRIEEIGQELAGVHQAMTADETLSTALLSPVLTRTAKAEILQALFEAAALEPLVVNFLRTLLEARKLPLLGDMVTAYARMVDEATGRVRGEALTPMPLEDSDLAALTNALSRATDKEVILEARTDPSLLGGVLARVGNLVFDGSIRTQLQRMRETLIKG